MMNRYKTEIGLVVALVIIFGALFVSMKRARVPDYLIAHNTSLSTATSN